MNNKPLKKKLFAAILVVTLTALAVSCAVTVVGLNRISKLTLDAANNSNNAILAEVRNGFYQNDIGNRLSAAFVGSKALRGETEDYQLMLDMVIAATEDFYLPIDDVLFLARGEKILAVRTPFPDSSGEYDETRVTDLLADSIDVNPSAYGIEPEPGETYTDILSYAANHDGVAAYSDEEGLMLVISPCENGIQLGILTPNAPSITTLRVLRETAEKFQSEAQNTVAEIMRSLIFILAAIWFVMAIVVFFIAGKTTSALADPIEHEKSERELALRRSEDEKQALMELDRLKTEFLGNIAHELKTPLTVMSAYAQDSSAALREGEDTATVERNMKVITAETERLALIVSQLLDITRIDESKMKMIMCETEPTLLVQDTLNTYYPLFTQSGNRIAFNRSGSLRQVRCDTDKIKQVLINLLTNAARHTRNGQIKVSVTEENAFARFTVEDNGDGISPEKLPHIFERYVCDNESGGRNTGTGLGLYISKYIIDQHGGEITAESRVGEGTKVSFTIPFITAA